MRCRVLGQLIAAQQAQQAALAVDHGQLGESRLFEQFRGFGGILIGQHELRARDHHVARDGVFEQPSLAGEVLPFPRFPVELAAPCHAVAA